MTYTHVLHWVQFGARGDLELYWLLVVQIKIMGSTLPLFPGGQDLCVDRDFCCSLSLVYNSWHFS